MMRALPLEFPSEQRVREIKDQFMFGPSLLVSPVVEQGAKERALWLPAVGEWVDFWTGKRQQGGETVKADARLARIPIYGREGSILPLGPFVQSAEDPADPLEIRVYPGKDADFIFYEDRGDGYSYEKGERATIPMHWDDHHRTLVIGPTSGSFPNMPKQLTLRIVCVHAGHGVGVLPEENADRVVQYHGYRVAAEVAGSAKTSSSEISPR